MRFLRIVPDRRVQNIGCEGLANALHDMGKTAMERMYRDGWKLKIGEQEATTWEWHLGDGKAEFISIVPERNQTIIEQQIHTTWAHANIETLDDDPLNTWDTENICGADVVLREHYMYSLAIDRRQLAPLPALFETLRLLRDNEKALVQIHLEPAPQDWNIGAQEAYEKLRAGRKPKRVNLSGKDIIEGVAKGTATVLLHTRALITELITGDETEPEPLEPPTSMYSDRRLSHHTMQKPKYGAFNVTIRVAAQSEDPGRRQVILRALGTTFRDLEGDNALAHKPVRHPGKWWRNVVRRRVEPKLNPDYLSTPEVARLLQLPTVGLQDEYDLAAVKHRESDLPDILLGDGIEIGTHTFRGEEMSVSVPVDESHWDELCLGRGIIGGMGSGKTKGFGGNWGAKALGYGFSVISIDVAKDELGDEIRTGAKKLGIPDGKLIRFEFGQETYKLDWVEAQGVKNTANRLAGEAVNFFRLHGADAGIETSRYLRLAGKTVGVMRGSLEDMVNLFIDDKCRQSAMEKLDDRQDLLDDWAAFEKLSGGMKGKVIEPVLNRLDMLLGDDYLRECMTATNQIDFRKYLTGGYHISLHIPKHELGAEAVDILVDFLMSKIELAMFARPEEEQIPCFVIADEPHQFESCAPRWERMAVECRKWRLGLVWMFHSFEQIPRGLAHRMKDAGMHYHLYTSSKLTYRGLEEEIAPFEIEEALRTPKYHAINVLRVGEEYIAPFMLKMSAPPSKWA